MTKDEILESQRIQIDRLIKALADIDSTLCACRHGYPRSASIGHCNCDIHAAHRIFDAELDRRAANAKEPS